MKVFISSLITGMEDNRAAARGAIEALGHVPVMAEDFGARAQSPQIACLDGIRQSSVVVLVLGAGYGAKQASGLSATHEEYREAKGSRPVIAFVQEDVTRDPDQAEFVREVQGWEGGLFRGGFRTPEQLRGLITRAVHEWELSVATAPLDGQEMLSRALARFPTDRDRNHHGSTALVVSIAGGPSQAILRPSEIEREQFAESVMQAALFGANRLYSPSHSTTWSIEDHDLIIRQDVEGNEVRLDTQGGMTISAALAREGHWPVVIEEDVAAGLAAILRFATWLLDTIDPSQRITHTVVAATLTGSDSLVWRTRAEQNASPNSYEMSGWGNDEVQPVHLNPAHRARAQLTLSAEPLIEDLVALLRRSWKGSR